ncbi:hypothetical protein SLS62_004011 [Diatrype stigma]|uniref:RBR-type E3 ubiquitin transferase n=1 Tax=Diatrype stigma TaxID=117547 RepID=A0AAN9UTV2_9PEZI
MDVSVFAQMEDEDALLIIQLLQEDAEEALANTMGKGKQPGGTETDQQLALELFLEELKDAKVCATDRSMAEGIQGNTAQLQVTSQASTPLDDEATVAGDLPESSDWATSRQQEAGVQKRHCEACRDPKHSAELAKAPCGHEYCRGCLTHLFQDAMLDESLFPPRCCNQHIPLAQNRLFLDSEVAREYPKKALEFSTPNRTYCHNQHCASFIPQEQCLELVAACEACDARTCIACKGPAHGGDCPNDGQLQEVLRLAIEQGWQRCSNCWGMIELHTGCNHMT